MRILKGLVIVFAVLVLIFLSIGFFAGSYEYRSTIQVQASPQKCWQIYNDTKLMNKVAARL